MADLLFWNTLIESVDWLNENQTEQFTPKSLIQKILDSAVLATKPLTGAPLTPTVIKALLPRGVQMASVWLFPKQREIGEFEKRMNERMIEAHGALVTGGVYTGHIHKQAIPLLPFQIADLITHGNIEIGLVHENQLDGYKLRESEHGFILPVGTPHIATIESCGITRDDLLSLANQLSESVINQAGDEAMQAPPLEHWKLIIQRHAYKVWQRELDYGGTPSVSNTKDEIAKWCVDNDVRTDSGNVHPTAEYLRSHVLSSKHWKNRPTKRTPRPEQPEQTEQT